ncbi:peptide/nickel transport system permease protein [Agreia bicolorata]|uniref:Peptide ABC transporter permease n=1 Tax=Agreia bicolorata TaxID=110935 RepID=A0A1T4YI28_9MICO|nr:ABC transporter permease [Agreia bicolorata]KJC63397.1 peptide ABC transporter permease [Agreia bicolorata]SKB01487.1 peptide/nickel transport system permease protein [Agreia bicolorata]
MRARLRGRLGLISAALFLVVVIVMAIAPWIFTPIDPLTTDTSQILQSPGWGHPFGTDQTGRDVFTRVVYGASYSLGVGAGATAAALIVGVVVGTLVGLAPRVVDGVAMRGVEILLAFPEFLIALFAIAVLGPGPINVAVAVGVAALPAYIRVARAETLVVRRSGYVEAAKGMGMHPLRVAVSHVVPNTLRPLGVIATIGIGTTIVAAAGLSFLGLGPQDPTPEWGLLLSGGRNLLGQAWWVAFFPGAMITLTVVSATVVGRRLRRAREGRRS